jgi:hypothetical protein
MELDKKDLEQLKFGRNLFFEIPIFIVCGYVAGVTNYWLGNTVTVLVVGVLIGSGVVFHRFYQSGKKDLETKRR